VEFFDSHGEQIDFVIFKRGKNMTDTRAVPKLRALDRAKTREFLSRVKRHPGLVENFSEHSLHDEETARHISLAAKTLWLLAIRTNMKALSVQLEEVFYKSYWAATGSRIEEGNKSFGSTQRSKSESAVFTH
jgi:hypothetical protein